MPKANTVHQPSPKVLACRANGRKGGLARAKNKSVAERKSWSSKGGRKTADLHGSDFYAHVGKQRKAVGRYSKPVKQKSSSKKVTA